MSRIVCDREELAKALKRLAVGTGSDISPIMGCVLLQASDQLHMTTASFWHEMRLSMAVEINEPWQAAINLAQFSGLISRLKDGSVEISLQEDGAGLLVKSGRSKYNLRTIPADDFPQVVFGDSKCTLRFEEPALLADFFSKSAQAAEKGAATMPGLNGVRLHAKDGVLVGASTDRFRLDTKHVATPDIPPDFSCVMPTEAASLIQGVAAKSPDPVVLEFGESLARMTCGSLCYVARMLRNEYPPYERVIPTLDRPTFKISAKEFCAAAERISAISKSDKDRPATALMRIEEGAVQLHSVSLDGHVADEGLDAEDVFDGETSVYFNISLMAETLARWGETDIDVHVLGPGKAIAMRHDAEPDRLHIVMSQIKA